jgi:hypothetical protein
VKSNKEFVDEVQRDLLRDLLPPKPAQPKADVVPFPPLLSQQELMRRQAVIDQCWAQNLARWRELERDAGFHRGPGDPDWPAA